MTNSSSKALQAFAANLQRLMDDPDTPYKEPKLVQKRAKELNKQVSYKMVERYLKCENEPSLGAVEAIAKVFGLEAWQMLLPNLQPGEHPEIHRRIAVEV